MRLSHSFPLLVAIAFGVFLPKMAHAQDQTKACIAASEEGQRLRDDRKMKRAREQFLLCMKETCPGIIKRDCAEWFNQAESAMSSVVPSARVCGKDIFDARVSVDGQVVAEKLDGKALPVDAGPHKFKFEIRDKKGQTKVVEEDVLVSEGQRNKSVMGSFESPAVDCGAGFSTTPPPATSAQAKKSFPLAPVLLGSLGLVAIGVGVVFDTKGFSEYDDNKKELEKTCISSTGQKTCTQSQVDDKLDPPKRTMLLGEIIMGAGIVATGVGVIWLIASGTSSDARTSRASTHPALPKLTGTPVPGGGVFGLTGQF